MDIKSAYRQTDVGEIPADWNVYTLGEIGKFKNGINKDSASFGHGSPFVNLMDVFGATHICSSENLGLIASSRFERASYDLKRGDVLFIRSSVKPKGVGLTAVVENDLPETVYSGFLIRFRDSGFVDLNYKKHCFSESGFRKAIISSSSVSANTNINQYSLKRLAICLPATQVEQRAIAEALNDADILVKSLEQTLAKKRHIKQGVMQELLTGKRRLTGFEVMGGVKQTDVGIIPDDWRCVTVAELAARKANAIVGGPFGSDLVSNDYVPVGVPVIRGQNMTRYIVSGDFAFVSTKKAKDLAANTAIPGDIVFTQRGTLGQVAIVPPIGFEEYIVSQSQMKLSPDLRNCDPGYLLQYFVSEAGQKKILESAIQTGVPHTNLGILKAYKLPMPCIEEQRAIAKALSDMDGEIETLEARVTKVDNLKQGMMQGLLTGRIRLV
jgi:type I restriction enzyme S subunit